MEALLAELLRVNQEMLSELRQLRQAICQDAASAPQPGLAATDAGARVPDADLALARQAPPRYTPRDLEAMSPIKPKQAPPRFTPKDLEDMRGQIMTDLKKRNRDAGNAFAEFEKRRKDW